MPFVMPYLQVLSKLLSVAVLKFDQPFDLPGKSPGTDRPFMREGGVGAQYKKKTKDR